MTTIPIRGRTDQPGTNILAVISGLLRNAFVEAIKPGVEGTVDLDRRESEEKQEAEKETKEELQEEKREDDGG